VGRWLSVSRNWPERSAPGKPKRAKCPFMRLFLALMLLSPAVALAQTDEDAAHRADRAQTQDLNRNVQRSVAQRQAADAAKLDRYRQASDDYARQRAEWRRQVAACQNGDTRACNPY
jgi:hypothetical protein